jgi:hypothetical protein
MWRRRTREKPVWLDPGERQRQQHNPSLERGAVILKFLGSKLLCVLKNYQESPNYQVFI